MLRWLYAELSPLGAPVYRGLAPGNTATPYIVFNWQGGIDQGDVNGHRLLNSSLYQVVAWGPAASYDAIETLSDTIDATIHRGNGTSGIAPAVDSEILFCDREQDLVVDQDVNGETWTKIGGLYRILIADLAPA